MAEINTTSAKQKGVKKMVKKSTRVDLTPMVDLGFLLITFFVFTTTMAKPKAMNVVSPKDGEPTAICETCVITMILADSNKVLYYEGIPSYQTILQQTTFNESAVRNILINKRNKVIAQKGNANNMVIIIKPSDKAVFKNFVDMVDEVAINDIKHYFIDEVSMLDKNLLAMNTK
jgi:biopolymer transport protein ExbD